MKFEVNVLHYDDEGDVVDQDYLADLEFTEVNLFNVLSALHTAGEDLSGIQEASIELSEDPDDGESFVLYDGVLVSYTFTERA